MCVLTSPSHQAKLIVNEDKEDKHTLWISEKTVNDGKEKPKNYKTCDGNALLSLRNTTHTRITIDFNSKTKEIRHLLSILSRNTTKTTPEKHQQIGLTNCQCIFVKNQHCIKCWKNKFFLSAFEIPAKMWMDIGVLSRQ